MCENDVEKETLECLNDGEFLEIHKAYIGQDVQVLFGCVGFDVSLIQNPCSDFPDKTKETKLKCDGHRSCSIRGSLEVNTCTNHRRYFHVEFSCKTNETKGTRATKSDAKAGGNIFIYLFCAQLNFYSV